MNHIDGPLGQLVSFNGARGIRLDGLLYRSEHARATIVHAHGSFGNFYQNAFVRSLARSIQSAGYNFLTFNLSAHDGLAEGYFADGSFRYVGASLVDFESCLEDLQGAVEFASGFCSSVVLSGHSLGCDRVLAATLHHHWTFPLVLLAPCDSYALQSNLISPETVEDQRQRLSETGEDASQSTGQFDWLDLKEYGVKSSQEWSYPNPITRRAFLSISQGAPYRLFRFDRDPTWNLDLRAVVVTPSSDALLTCSPMQVRSYFSKAFTSCKHVITPGDHLFTGAEGELAHVVTTWVQGLTTLP